MLSWRDKSNSVSDVTLYDVPNHLATEILSLLYSQDNVRPGILDMLDGATVLSYITGKSNLFSH